MEKEAFGTDRRVLHEERGSQVLQRGPRINWRCPACRALPGMPCTPIEGRDDGATTTVKTS